jgi:cell division protein FtsI (penicillin-binding protein 3)
MAGYQASANRPMTARVRLFTWLFFAMLAAVMGKAVHLQVFMRADLERRAHDQYLRELSLAPRRGEIVDARGTPLAVSVDADSVFLDARYANEAPKNRREPPPVSDEQVLSLARALSLDADDLRLKFSRRDSGFTWLKRRVTAEESKAVAELKIKGVGTSSEFKRYYPQKNLAAHLLGTMDVEGHGLEGLELLYDEPLRGDAALRKAYRDARGRTLLDEPSESTEHVVGATVQLTLDAALQHAAEQALAAGVERARAKGGVAVVMEPSTGAILAMANFPTFNPNAPEQVGSVRLNRILSSPFEPGSTMKCFLNGAALSEKLVTPDTVIDVSGGVMQIGKRRVRDSHRPHENAETVRKVLETSSNVGSARIGLKLGKQRLMDWYRKFGFGARPGSGLAGESKGLLFQPERMGDIETATSAFGQGISATPLQMTAALSAIANDGVLMKPYVVAKVTRADGEVLSERRPEPVRRVLESTVAKTLTGMMRGVVDEGTGSKAAIAGFAVAGKTGTAQKVDPKTRSYGDKRFSSFMGFLPAEKPRFAIYVAIDEPTGEVYGGTVAAPIFREIALSGLHEFSIQPDVPVDALEVAVVKRKANASKADARPESTKDTEEKFVEGFDADGLAAAPDALAAVDGTLLVPDLKGRSVRAALRTLGDLGLEADLEGFGRVTAQEPEANAVVAPGSRVHVTLGGEGR